MGYARAGFEVTGVDIKKQKRYPYEFIQADALEVIQDQEFLSQFDVLVGSPPCQTHSVTQHLRVAQGRETERVDLIPQTREAFIKSGKPYIIENVPGSPLIDPVVVCGSHFDLKVRRHRLFESNVPMCGTICNHKAQGKPVGVYGAMNDNPKGIDRRDGRFVVGGQTARTIEEAKEAMGIDWMIWTELVEAIPPAYTEYLGKQLLEAINE